MRTLSTLFLPWLRFFQVGLPHAGGICLLLQLSLVGWPLAVRWSMRERDRYNVDRLVDWALAGVVRPTVKN